MEKSVEWWVNTVIALRSFGMGKKEIIEVIPKLMVASESEEQVLIVKIKEKMCMG